MIQENYFKDEAENLKTQRLSQKERILNYIKEHGKIDRIQAFFEEGVLELAARIADLEKDGYVFNKVSKRGKSKKGYSFNYTEYSLKVA